MVYLQSWLPCGRRSSAVSPPAACGIERDHDRPAAHVDCAARRLYRRGRLAVPVLMVNRQGRDSPPHTRRSAPATFWCDSGFFSSLTWIVLTIPFRAQAGRSGWLYADAIGSTRDMPAAGFVRQGAGAVREVACLHHLRHLVGGGRRRS